MDMVQAARFFDLQNFDTYNFTSASWQLNAFQGQLKLADVFVSIWNRPTRKRMLYCNPDSLPNSTVVRVPNTQEIFLLGTGQADTHANAHYREVYGLHRSAGVAVLNRKTPVEVLGVRGWAVDATVQTTFGDVELRSVNENQDAELINYGHFFMFLPSNCPVVKHDTVTINGVVYYVLETYTDSGYSCCRVTSSPDERVNFTYTSKGVQAYNTATQTTSGSDTTYNVTGKVTPMLVEDIKDLDIQKDHIKLMLVDSFISFDPKVQDTLTFDGKTYTVERVQRDSLLQEWYLVACR